MHSGKEIIDLLTTGGYSSKEIIAVFLQEAPTLRKSLISLLQEGSSSNEINDSLVRLMRFL